MTTAAKKAAEKKAETKPTEDDAPKRKSYTPEEKIAKLENDLNEARAKAQAKRTKAIEAKTEERDKAQAKVDDQRLKVAEIQKEIDELTAGGSYFGEDLDAGDDPVVAAQDEATAAATSSDDD